MSTSGPVVGNLIDLRVSHELEGVESYTISSITPLQELWDGFGLVSRVVCKPVNGGASRTVIAKHVSPPPLTGSPTSKSGMGHLRKLDSFCRELNTYRLHPLFGAVRSARPPVHGGPRQYTVPLLLAFSTNLAAPYKNGAQLTAMTMWLEDMCETGHTVLTKRRPMSQDEVLLCLDWLVWLHAATVSPSSTKPGGSPSPTDRGTYWYLSTRPHELEWLQRNSPPGSLEAYLCTNASRLADALFDGTTFKCTLHGDPKPPNFLASKDGTRIAGVDFQYAGMGCGPQDVVYLLTYDWKAHSMGYRDFWAYYFRGLATALQSRSDLSDADRTSILAEWRAVTPVALADFARFYCGWSQGSLEDGRFSDAEIQIIDGLRKGKTFECIY